MTWFSYRKKATFMAPSKKTSVWPRWVKLAALPNWELELTLSGTWGSAAVFDGILTITLG